MSGHATLMSRQPDPVYVEYTDPKTGERVKKHFTDHRKSKSFYMKMSKEGRSPRIIKA